MKSRHSMSKVAMVAPSAASKEAKVKKEVIGKGDLLVKLQAATSFKKKDIELVLESFVAVIHDEVLHKGAELRLRDFGTFKQKKTQPRSGRNPKTGEPIEIAGASSVTFSASAGTFKIKNE
eukprot:CAMPEP_0184988158 /NCGR_PEP_ID=MMETSP1098-20130426/23185_1 /TAXON_ID=89044 /ORGANISM="Spumella elongata, Strain CCAP 955/1" /LENGTH=120 /DNA_ID=CAMNT_0027512847 /DNA_START=119 /DNA_END=481 /DNA_ORIENTATION=-